MRSLIVVLGVLSLVASQARAQIVNVLPAAKRDAEGWDGSLTGAVDWRTGATDLGLLSGRARLSHRQGGRLALAIVDGEFGRKSGDRFAARHFEHGRIRQALVPWLSAEAFVQYEGNEFRRLASRALGGVGLRAEKKLGANGTASGGSTYMREREQLRAGDEEDAGDVDALHRWSNYLAVEGRPSDITTVSFTVFAQPRLDDFADLRLLGELDLALAVTERVSVRLSFTLTHDSRPPTDVNTTDTRAKTSLTVQL